MGPPGPAGPALLLDGGVLPVSTSDGFSFAGFTTATFTGNLGGPIGANAKCAAEFAGSHLCTEREFEWPGPRRCPARTASGPMTRNIRRRRHRTTSRADRSGSYSCDNWRSQDGCGVLRAVLGLPGRAFQPGRRRMQRGAAPVLLSVAARGLVPWLHRGGLHRQSRWPARRERQVCGRIPPQPPLHRTRVRVGRSRRVARGCRLLGR